MPSFAELRARHPELSFDSYSAEVLDDELVIEFSFTLHAAIKKHSHQFKPRVVIHHVPKHTAGWLRKPLAQQLLLQLGMIELVSYWKATCSPKVIIRAGEISATELQWWRETWIMGLGEFWYKNQIDPTQPDLLNFTVQPQQRPAPAGYDVLNAVSNSGPSPKKNRLLIPVGGGKDSAALLGWLQTNQVPFGALLLEPHSPAAREVTTLSQARETITVTRTIDPELKALNAAGYLNGHTPFSAYLGWVSVLTAELFGYEEVAVANEQSANEANMQYHGLSINHQYSKTTAYEVRFRAFLQMKFGAQYPELASYFSIWRPLHELQIAQLFSQYPDFFSAFKSCNVHQQKNSWCHHCSKCVFVYSILAPFIEIKTLSTQIFQHDLFADVTLVPIWKQLLGFEADKPFECVGTKAEILAALGFVIDRYERAGIALPAALAALLQEPALAAGIREVIPAGLGEWLQAFAAPHFLPTDLELLLQKSLKTQPRFEQIVEWREHKAVKVLADADLAILGLGREGWVSYGFLRQLFPTKHFVLGDAKTLTELPEHWREVAASDPLITFVTGADFLEQAVRNADYLFMTPGLRTDGGAIQAALRRGAKLHSQTQLFFELCPAKIIGITGTKGKSTTSSLIHHVLKENNLPTVLVGNIGTPALSELANITPDNWVVAELSCHQLQHLTVSPDIAVIQNITSEHLDYYPDTAAYVKAKSAIARFQTAENFVIYDPHFETPRKMAALGKAKALRFAVAEPEKTANAVVRFAKNQFWLRDVPVIAQAELPLLGEHNLANVAPAIIVGDLVGLKPAGIKNAIKTFVPLPHRLQLVATTPSAQFYDDSLSTTPEATIAALSGFKEKAIILLAGGYERHQDFTELAEAILKAKVQGLVLFPTTGTRLKQNLLEVQGKLTQVVGTEIKPVTLPQMIEISSMAEAVAAAQELALQIFENQHQRAIVLLSPASASFNSFKDYHDRGQQFAVAANGAPQA
jgi:UDP-N-acetylmuramoylalanine--D-glutamate ligase